jgi:hypothetical protein
VSDHRTRREWAQLQNVCGSAEERVPPLFVFGSSASDLSALVRAFFADLHHRQACAVFWANALEATSMEVLLMRLTTDRLDDDDDDDDNNNNNNHDDNHDNLCRGTSLEQFVLAVQQLAKASTTYFVIDHASHLREFGAAALDLLLRVSELCRGANVTTVLISTVPYALYPRVTHGTLPFVIKVAARSRDQLRDAILQSGAMSDAAFASYFVAVFGPVVGDLDAAITLAERVNASCAGNSRPAWHAAAQHHLKRLVATAETSSLEPIDGGAAGSTSLLEQQLLLAAFFAANTDRSVDDPLWSRTGAQLAKAREIKLLEQPALFSYERLRHILELMCAQRRGDADDAFESFLDEDLVQTEIASLVERGALVRKWRALGDELKFRCTLTASDACAVAERWDRCEAERGERRRGGTAAAKSRAHGFVELMKSLL